MQNIDGKLTDFTRPPYNKWAGLDSAIERGDTLKTTPELAKWFTTSYKKFFPKFSKGGELIPKAQIGRTLTYNWASPRDRVTTLEQRKKMYEKVNPSLGQNFISAIQLGKTYLGLSDRGTAPVRDEEYFKKYLGLPYDEKLVPKSKYRPVIDTLNVQYTGIDDRTKHYIQQMVDTNLVKNRINELYDKSDNTVNENQAANYRRTASNFEKHLGTLRNMYANPGNSYVVSEGNSLYKELLPAFKGIQTIDTGMGFLKDFTVTNLGKDLISVKDDYDLVTPAQRFLGGTPYPIYDRVSTKINYLKRYNQKK